MVVMLRCSEEGKGSCCSITPTDGIPPRRSSDGPAGLPALPMCNLYSITTNQAAIINLFRVINRYVGNLAPMPGVFPDYPAPVIRNTDTGTEMTLMRWGMPPPPRTSGPPVTTSARHPRGTEDGSSPRTAAWSQRTALPNTDRSRTQRPRKKMWSGSRSMKIAPCSLSRASGPSSEATEGTKSKLIPGPHLVYGFLTTAPNAVVEPIHPKAMPVILTTDEARRLDARPVGRGQGVAAVIAG